MTVETPVVISTQAYTSESYARNERDRLWARAWQVACREEELTKVGDYVTYDVARHSIVLVRTPAGEIRGYYNVCQHRGRRLTEGCGRLKLFACRFHGWKWDLDGENIDVPSREDWGEALTADNLRLPQVEVGTFGGWVFINMDPGCEPFEAYIAPVRARLAPFELERMRYRWRQWTHVAANWKTVLEAFIESYHVAATHPQLFTMGSFELWGRVDGEHSWHGYTTRDGGISIGLPGQDPRQGAADFFHELYSTINATTTETFVAAAKRMAEELPAGMPGEQVLERVMAAAYEDDAARGVRWPAVTPDQFKEAGVDWHIFPNTVMLPGLTQALCYRARPDGFDPDRCIFEVYVIERFPEGGEPATEWKHAPDLSEELWLKVLAQDFANIPEVQSGVWSKGFKGPRPNPVQEASVIHFHRTLARYMGEGEPTPI